MSAMVEEERVAAEVGKLRGVLHRGRRVDDLRRREQESVMVGEIPD